MATFRETGLGADPETGHSPHSVDLLVATVGRTAELARLLHSLRAQSYTNFRVLVADQNPQGTLAPVLDAFSDLHIETLSVPPAGVSAARNALLPRATASIIAFPDDDCWYAPDTLAQAVAFFSSHPQAGTAMAVWGQGPEAIKRIGAMNKPLNFLDCFRRGETYVQFFRRETATAVGLFDTRLGPGGGNGFGGGEDTDYLLRALQIAPVVRVPSLVVFHPEVDDNAQIAPEKMRLYAAGRMAILKKHHLPLWFQLANVLYPLAAALRCTFAGKPRKRSYFLTMFLERLAAWTTPFPEAT